MVNRSYGYGVTATPLQLTAAGAAAINGGILHTPRLVAGKRKNGRTIPEIPMPSERVIKERVSRQLRQILRTVVLEGGTAQSAAVEGYTVAGKTGTARKVSRQGGYAKGRYFSSFLGFVPADTPELVIFVGIDEPGGKHFYGGKVAAPVFREVAQEVLPLMAVLPEQPKRRAMPKLARELYPRPKGKDGKEDESDLRYLSLGQALERLHAQGIVPLVRGSGQVAQQVETPKKRLRLYLQ